MDEFVLLSWKPGNTWNLNFDFKYFRFVRIAKQIRFLEEVAARQFWFKIYWPLVCNKSLKICRCKRWCPKVLQIRAPAAPMLTHSLWSVSMYYSTTSHHTTVHCPLLWEILIHCATDQSNSIFGTALQPQSNCWLQCWGAKNKSSHDVLLHTWWIVVDYSEPKVYRNLLWSS